MKKTLLIVNPVSGKIRIRPLLLDILGLLAKSGREVSVVITQYRGHATEIVEKQAAAFDEVLCCGGDGTLNEVISGIMRSGIEVPCGYIPAGSTNDFAKCMGISTKLRAAVNALILGKSVSLDVGEFNADSYFSYIASFGAFTAASYNTPQSSKNSLGHFAYVLQGIKDLKTIAPIQVAVRNGEKEYVGKYVFGAVMNSRSVGGIVKLREGLVDMRDGIFECILVRMPRNPVELGKIVRAIHRSDFSGEMFDFFKSSALSFQFESESKWSLDGEFRNGGSFVTIRNRKEAISLIQ